MVNVSDGETVQSSYLTSKSIARRNRTDCLKSGFSFLRIYHVCVCVGEGKAGHCFSPVYHLFTILVWFWIFQGEKQLNWKLE